MEEKNSFQFLRQFYSYLCAMESSVCMHAQSCLTLGPAARQAPLSMELSRQEYWIGLPFPTPRESSRPNDQTCISCLSCVGRWILYHCTTSKSRNPEDYTKQPFKCELYLPNQLEVALLHSSWGIPGPALALDACR